MVEEVLVAVVGGGNGAVPGDVRGLQEAAPDQGGWQRRVAELVQGALAGATRDRCPEPRRGRELPTRCGRGEHRQPCREGAAGTCPGDLDPAFRRGAGEGKRRLADRPPVESG